MVQVKIINSVYVEATDTQYDKGQTYEVSDALAKRHLETGLMKEVDVLPDPEPVTLRKTSTKK